MLEKYKDVRDFEKKSIKIKEGCSVLGNETLDVLKTILNYLRIAAVALLLVLGSLDFAGAVMSDKEDAMKSAGSKFKNRLIACVVVFLIPALVNVALFVVNKSESTCNLFGGEMEKTVEFSNGNVVSSPSNSGSTPSASVKPVDPPITSSAPSPSSTPSVKPSNSPTPTISSSPSPTPSASSKPSTNKKKEYKILFIGNSFTEKNNMPNLFKKLVEGTGKKVTVSSVTKNGHQLIKFADFSTTEGKKVEKALKKKWDYVVLQDASRSFLEKDPTTLKAVQKLNKYIKKSGAKTILYMTWPFKNTHEIYSDSTYKIRNPEKFYEKVKDGYNNVAKKTGATVAPVGTSFMRLINQNSKINLYANDKYHPSKYGSFLAACTIYDTIYQERSSKSSYNGGLSSKYAKTLKSTADAVCF